MMEYGEVVYNDLNTNTMNKNKSVEELIDSIEKKLDNKAQSQNLEDEFKLIHNQAKTDGKGVENKFLIRNSVTILPGDDTPFLPERVSGIGKPPRPVSILNYINITETSRGAYIDWIEEETETVAAGIRAQNEAAVSGARTYKNYSAPMIMTSGEITCTREQLSDYEWMTTELTDELIGDNRDEMSDQVLNGDGVGSNMSGLFTISTAFAAGDFAGAVAGATTRDVILCAINQAELSNYKPNLIVLNPTDYTNMQFGITDTLFDIPVLTSTTVTKDNFLVMDGSKAMLYLDDSMRVIFSEQYNDNPVTNRVTALLHARGALKVYHKNYDGFISGLLSTGLAAITPA